MKKAFPTDRWAVIATHWTRNNILNVASVRDFLKAKGRKTVSQESATSLTAACFQAQPCTVNLHGFKGVLLDANCSDC